VWPVRAFLGGFLGLGGGRFKGTGAVIQEKMLQPTRRGAPGDTPTSAYHTKQTTRTTPGGPALREQHETLLIPHCAPHKQKTKLPPPVIGSAGSIGFLGPARTTSRGTASPPPPQPVTWSARKGTEKERGGRGGGAPSSEEPLTGPKALEQVRMLSA